MRKAQHKSIAVEDCRSWIDRHSPWLVIFSMLIVSAIAIAIIESFKKVNWQTASESTTEVVPHSFNKNGEIIIINEYKMSRDVSCYSFDSHFVCIK